MIDGAAQGETFFIRLKQALKACGTIMGHSDRAIYWALQKKYGERERMKEDSDSIFLHSCCSVKLWIPGRVQCQVGQSSEQPGLVGDVPRP